MDNKSTTLNILRLEGAHELELEGIEQLRSELQAEPKQLPARLLYDARGSELFEQITRQPEYYPTRAEAEILERFAGPIMERYRPTELVEVGSGYSRKTRALIEGMLAHGGTRYVPFDVSEDAVRAAADALCVDYAELEVRGVIGDFHRDLHSVPRAGRRVVAFLGSTVGNFPEEERGGLLAEVRSLLEPGDALLLGFDLVKDRETLERAYNDSAGVTQAFIENVLVVLNRDYAANFPIEQFRFRATWDKTKRRVDIGLVASKALNVRVESLDLDLSFAAGELMRAEVSTKFTPADMKAELAQAGLETVEFHFDRARRFCLCVAEPAAGATNGTSS